MTTDDEMNERYQRAVVSARQLRYQSRNARAAGSIDTLAEYETALNEGFTAALVWLLGLSAVAPVTSVPAVVDRQRIVEELQAAERLAAAPEPGDNGTFPESFDGDPRWADGVVDILRWQLERITTAG